jgi:hypothetical protein
MLKEGNMDSFVQITVLYIPSAKLCRQQAEVIQNHENENVCNIGQGEPRHRCIHVAIPSLPSNRSSNVDAVTLETTLCDYYAFATK